MKTNWYPEIVPVASLPNAFTDADLRRAGFSNNAIKKLYSRQKGGTSGARGFAYQRRYALLRTVELAHVTNASVQMEALCPVDDVVTRQPSLVEHAQCKTSKDTWGKGKKKLEKEFTDQRRLLRALGVANSEMKLVLVVADANCHTQLQKAIPPKLQKVTRVEHFPLAAPEHHPWTVTRFADALDALLPPLLRGPSSREDLYYAIDRVAREPWQPAKVSDILDAAGQDLSLPLVFPQPRQWTVTPTDWSNAKYLLGLIQGLTIHTTGDVCCYSEPNGYGFIARCDTPRFARFVQDVISDRPSTINDFFRVRPV